MKQSQKGRRGRNRNSGRRPQSAAQKDNRQPRAKNRNQIKQQIERYQTMAREAVQAQDIVKAENGYQHADYYQRLLNELDKPAADQRQTPKSPPRRPDNQHRGHPEKADKEAEVIKLETGDGEDAGKGEAEDGKALTA
ncbi:MAG: DUF4167 domain-containing protein [Sphingomonadales bacterium]